MRKYLYRACLQLKANPLFLKMARSTPSRCALLFKNKGLAFNCKHAHKILFSSVISFLLVSCSFLSPVKLEPNNAYLLNSVPQSFPHHHKRSITLLVTTPETRPAFDTRQMAYTIKPYQVAYFAENQWAETPGQMLRVSLVQTLRNTHYFRTVAMTPFVGQYDYMLNTQILTIEQNFIGPPRVNIVINAQLLNANNQLVRNKQFAVNVPMYEAAPYAGVVAANRGMEILLRQIAAFCF